MKLNINQNGERVILELPDKKGRDHVLEFAASTIDPSHFAYWVDREEALVFNLPKDGFYKYYIFPSSYDVETLENLCKDGLETFLQHLDSPNNSIGPLTPENEYDIFSIHHLRSCVMQMEKEAIWEFVEMCRGKNCKNKTSDKSTKDLLLIAIFVLENLIAQERYTEAQIILDSLSTCANICNTNKTFTCNCNG